MYVIIGANGFLGHYFIKNILAETQEKILALDLTLPDETETSPRLRWQQLDVTDIPAVEALYENLKDQPLHVIYLAAYHHPDKVLQNPQLAWKINIIALAHFLNIFEKMEHFYYPSTEVVYGEAKEGQLFHEQDRLTPSNMYGKHKEIAERMVITKGHHVVRFPVLMGPSLVPGKKHFYDEIVEALKNGKEMEMFTDNIRSFIDFNTASRMVLRLMQTPEGAIHPIVNIAGDEGLSKYELALRIARKHNLRSENIKPISMSESGIFKASRSKTTLLDNRLLKQILGLKELKIQL